MKERKNNFFRKECADNAKCILRNMNKQIVVTSIKSLSQIVAF